MSPCIQVVVGSSELSPQWSKPSHVRRDEMHLWFLHKKSAPAKQSKERKKKLSFNLQFYSYVKHKNWVRLYTFVTHVAEGGVDNGELGSGAEGAAQGNVESHLDGDDHLPERPRRRLHFWHWAPQVLHGHALRGDTLTHNQFGISSYFFI